jgi:hypothetical protein
MASAALCQFVATFSLIKKFVPSAARSNMLSVVGIAGDRKGPCTNPVVKCIINERVKFDFHPRDRFQQIVFDSNCKPSQSHPVTVSHARLLQP